MNGDVQKSIIEFLASADAFGSGTGYAERVETHISVVFLAGDRAYKLKRAVRYPYLDFSTLEMRKAACDAEVRLNRRTAPTLYKGVVAVTREVGGRLAVGGTGVPVEWLVEMARFEEETRFDRLAAKGALDRHTIEDLADAIAAFHADAEIKDADTVAGLGLTIEGDKASMESLAGGIFDVADIGRLAELSRRALAALAPLLQARRRAGRVRRCHGDLHLRNICMVDGRPTLFDAIEFNDTFADIDVLYDLGFLVMDLDRRGRRRLANVVLNRYLDISADDGGLPCLPLFLSLRAAIRAHVQATAATKTDDAVRVELLRTEAREYLAAAFEYLAPGTPPMLIAVGGLSGSGKSRLARALAPFVGAAPGARVQRTDVIRKRLMGKGPLVRLGPEGYTRDMSERTYEALYELVRASLAAGRTTIADAVFADADERRRIAAVAAETGVAFHGFWLEAPTDVMERRVSERKRNASDATAEIVRRQADYDLGTIEWTRVDSAGSKAATLAQALAALEIATSAPGEEASAH